MEINKYAKTLPFFILGILFFVNHSFSQSFRQYDEYRGGWWSFGIDGGLSYQNSDVDRTFNGYGFGASLGKNIYYKKNGMLSADLRGRWLYMRAYGIDGEKNFNIQNNEIANHLGYNNYPAELNIDEGFIYNNHRTTLSTLDAELVIHFERLRQRTNIVISPYGGIGLGFHYTGTNLKNDGQAYFDSFAGIDDNLSKSQTKKEIKSILDDSFESAADGYLDRGIRANFMPSLGIELGYAFSPRFSIVLDHRATYTLRDYLDGQQYANNDNDVQLYTSLGLRWRIYPKERTPQKPEITITNPDNCPDRTDGHFTFLEAEIKYVYARSGIELFLNGRRHDFDFEHGRLTSRLDLVPGNNFIRIKAKNSDGEAIAECSIERMLISAPRPEIIVTNPPNEDYDASFQRFNLDATIYNVRNRRDIEFELNGRGLFSFDFTPANGKLSAQLDLNEGENIYKITARNEVGLSIKTGIINFQERTKPNVQITRPSSDPFETNASTFRIEAQIDGIQNRSQIKVYINDKRHAQFSYNTSTGKFSTSIPLNELNQTIEIQVENENGSDEDAVTIKKRVANLPIVEFITPSKQNTTEERISVKANIQNVSKKSGISFTVNGRRITDFAFRTSNGSLSAMISLEEGENTIKIVATNDDGSAEATRKINYIKSIIQPVSKPKISIQKPENNSIVDNENMELQAKATGVNSKNDIQVSLNGNNITAFSFTKLSGSISADLVLRPGKNEISVTGNNSVGSDTETTVVEYNITDLKPKVEISIPANNTTVNDKKTAFRAKVTNINSKNQIKIELNNKIWPSFSLSANNVNAALTLKTGMNSIKITVENQFGSATAQHAVIYIVPIPEPTITFIDPEEESISVNKAQYNVLAKATNIDNIDQIEVTLNGNRIEDFSFDIKNGEIKSQLNLRRGPNVIQISLENQTAKVSASREINYKIDIPDIGGAPKIEIISSSKPVADPFNPTVAMSKLVAKATGIKDRSEIKILNNGKNVNGFSYNDKSGEIKANIQLSKGNNEIKIVVTNRFGTDQATTIVTF